jgi:hypothetical protein
MAKHKRRKSHGKAAFKRCLSTNLKGKTCKGRKGGKKKCQRNKMKRVMRKCRKKL